MPILTNNETTQQTIAFHNDLFIAPGASVMVTTGSAIDTSSGDYTPSLINYGTLVTNATEAVEWLADGGSIYNDGIIASGSAYSARAVSFNAHYVDAAFALTNGPNGQIIGGFEVNSYGVPVGTPIPAGDNLVSLQNSGLITVLPDQYNNNNSAAVRLLTMPAHYNIDNSGTISGEIGVYFQQLASYGGDFVLFNTGEIIGTAGEGLRLYANANNNETLLLNNSGRIASLNDDAIYAFAGNWVLNNLEGGVIEGRINFAGDWETRLTNDGLIVGDVDLWDGSDHVTNSGSIQGNVNMGAHDDRYIGQGGTVTGSIDMGGGDDLARVDQDYLVIDGGAGNDTLIVTGDRVVASGFETIFLNGSADISVDGGATDDKIWGNFGANGIGGGDGADTIRSGNGDDTIEGGAGDDILYSGSGNDEIVGGGGKDLMNGGADADIFVFEAVSDSGTTGATADIIKSFEHGVDRIDMSFLTNPAFIGTGAFTGGGTAEIRVQLLANNNSRLLIDADGNGTTDMMITMLGQQTFDADDFIL
ncbi:calcium-binding protein [Tropicibacter alexandrii]|uniref:calcium-binding protein n=1 Tax=Tropicibacter alexandrii TaxID=2267683 RepID=UPI000EF55463|nr:calcium-binding protein [Tropicibacter alexandrii]